MIKKGFRFKYVAHLTRFDVLTIVRPDDSKDPPWYVRGSATVFGVDDEGHPVDEDGYRFDTISREPWTNAEKKEMEERQKVYAQSMSCGYDLSRALD